MKKIFFTLGVAALLITIVFLSGCSETSEDTGATGSSDEDEIIPPAEPENATVSVQGFSGYIKFVLTKPGINYQSEGYLSSDIRIYIDDVKVALSSGSYNLSKWKVAESLTVKADDGGARFGLLGVGSDYVYEMESRDYSVRVYVKGSLVYDNVVNVS